MFTVEAIQLCTGNISISKICLYLFIYFNKSFVEMDSTTASGMKPSFLAHKILQAVKYRQDAIVLAPLLHKLVILIRTFFPSLFFLTMNLRAKSGKKEFTKLKKS